MRTLERIEQYLAPDVEISDEELAKARFKFGDVFGKRATELKLSSKSLNTLLAEYGKDNRPVVLTDETVQGLKIIEDGSLPSGHWLVGWSAERLNEVA